MSKRIRCAIYTRKSTDEGLDQDFNSLDAQREACESYIQSQRGQGWVVRRKRYDDGGISGGTMDRPALQELLADIEKGKVDLVIVYKVDRLTRSLMDFAKIIETFDSRNVSFVSVTQQFNTANSMGRLTLNVLLSFAQFEREVTAERIRDKIVASKKKGMWMGGLPPLGYDAVDKKLVINSEEADTVRAIFGLYLDLGSIRDLAAEATRRGYGTKRRPTGARGGKAFSRGHLAQLLRNPIYIGRIAHRDETFPGQHDAIIDQQTWDAAQRMLDGNCRGRWSRSNKNQACLLTGLLFDESGDRLTPSYSNKKGRRYRYYTSSRLINEPDAKNGWRLPADQIEQAVLDGLVTFLNDNAPEDAKLVREIEEGTIEAGERVRSLLERVNIEPGNLRLEISRTGFSDIGMDDLSQTFPETIDLPLCIRRRGVESKVIIPGVTRPRAPDAELVKVVSDARAWFERLAEGKAETIKDIAQADDVDPGDISRFIPLAFLGPDIVEAILGGKQPIELTAEKLKRLRHMPFSWKDQQEFLGFSDDPKIFRHP